MLRWLHVHRGVLAVCVVLYVLWVLLGSSNAILDREQAFLNVFLCLLFGEQIWKVGFNPPGWLGPC